MDEVRLRFTLQDNLFSGQVLYGDTGSGERGAVVLSAFEAAPLTRALGHLAMQACPTLETGGQLQVTARRADLQAATYLFDEEQLALLCADSSQVALTLQVTASGDLTRRRRTGSPLRVGYDALAMTFGDDVYVRRRGDWAECPGCGCWALNGEPTLHCRSAACGIVLALTSCGPSWARTPTASLLGTNRDEFFLPRGWNELGPWTSRERLEHKYNSWLTIKETFR